MAVVCWFSQAPFCQIIAQEKNSVPKDTQVNQNQLELEEVVVTAQKREEKIQDIPASITAISLKGIEDAGIKSTTDIYAYVPNLTSFGLTKGPIGFSSYGIRGQTNFNSYSNSVGIYIDDVPRLLSANMTNSSLWDVEQIEVLRGPQGNLYGLSSSGGIINITTRKPDNEWTGNGGVVFGSYNRMDYQASVSGPIIPDKLFVGISGTNKNEDSFIEEEGDDDRRYEFNAVRAQIRWTPSSKLEVQLNAENGEQDRNFMWFTYKDDDPYKIPSHNYDEYDNSKYQILSLKIKYETPKFDIVSITGSADLKQEVDMELFQNGAFHRKNNVPASKIIQELRLVSNDEISPLKWMVGLFFQQGTEETDLLTQYSGVTTQDLKSETKKTANSYFGQASYAFTKKLAATAGIRFDTEKQEYEEQTSSTSTSVSYDLSDTWNAVSPRLSVDYRIDEEMMVYGSAAKGFKAGGFTAMDGVDKQYDPEEVISYELGMKSNWLNNKLIFNLCGFYTIADDLQVSYYDSDLNFRYENTAKAVMYGFETELAATPLEGLQITLPIGFVQSEVKEHETDSLVGNQVPLTPEYTAAIIAQYNHHSGFFVRGEYNMVGKTYYDEENKKLQNAYGLLNAKMGYGADHFTVSAYVNNALDTEYYTYIIDMGSAYDWASVGAPLTAGIELSAMF